MTVGPLDEITGRLALASNLEDLGFFLGLTHAMALDDQLVSGLDRHNGPPVLPAEIVVHLAKTLIEAKVTTPPGIASYEQAFEET
jgi:hypothetical protein